MTVYELLCMPNINFNESSIVVDPIIKEYSDFVSFRPTCADIYIYDHECSNFTMENPGYSRKDRFSQCRLRVE